MSPVGYQAFHHTAWEAEAVTSNQAFDVIEIVAILASGLIFYFAQVRRPCFPNVRLTVLQLLLQ